MAVKFRCLRHLVLCTTCSIVVGCGDSTTIGPESEASSKQEVADVDVASVASFSPKPTVYAPDEVWQDDDGRKYLGRVPYDVFFDNPLEVAAEGTPVASSSKPDAPIAIPVTDETSLPEPVMAEQQTKDGVDWATQLPVDVLESELKSARNFLKEKLRSVASYNSAVTMIPVRVAMIAVLSGIAAEHSGDISWKDDALYVRDLAWRMNETVLKRGPKDQRRLLRLFEDLADTLNRSRPAGLEDPSSELTLSDAADMGNIMLRIEESEQRLRTEVTEEIFRSQATMVQHEASLMAGLVYDQSGVLWFF